MKRYLCTIFFGIVFAVFLLGAIGDWQKLPELIGIVALLGLGAGVAKEHLKPA